MAGAASGLPGGKKECETAAGNNMIIHLVTLPFIPHESTLFCSFNHLYFAAQTESDDLWVVERADFQQLHFYGNPLEKESSSCMIQLYKALIYNFH